MKKPTALERLSAKCGSQNNLKVGEVIVTNIGRKVMVQGQIEASDHAGVTYRVKASRWIETRQKFSVNVEWVYFNSFKRV